MVISEDKPKPKKIKAKIKTEVKKKKAGSSRLSIINKTSSYKKCKDFYVGIGIIYGWFDNAISSIAKNGPADKAGFKVGDKFANYSSIKDANYTPGTLLNIDIIRNGINITIPVMVDKICTDKD